jgi:hypothetical protein
MSSFSLHEKITCHEVKTWYLNSLDMEVDTIDGEAAWSSFMDHKPVDFKVPRKERAAKKSSTPAERADAPYDETKCDTRVYKGPSIGGWGCQCSSKKIDGQNLCKSHQKEADAHDGQCKNGFITGPRPTHHFADESEKLIPWHDVELPEKKKKANKTSGEKAQRKCGVCGECGHNKRNCPNDQPIQPKEKTIAEMEADLAAAKAKAVEQVEQVEEVDQVEQVDEVDQVEDGELDEDDEDESDEDDEGESDGIDCEFEGVFYTRDKDDNTVYNDQCVKVGEWESLDDMIVFNEYGKLFHKAIDCGFEGVEYTRDKGDDKVYTDYYNKCDEVGEWESLDDMIVFSKFGKRFHNHAKAQLAID